LWNYQQQYGLKPASCYAPQFLKSKGDIKKTGHLTAVTGLWADHHKNFGWFPAGSRDLCLLQCSEWLWGLSSLLFRV